MGRKLQPIKERNSDMMGCANYKDITKWGVRKRRRAGTGVEGVKACCLEEGLPEFKSLSPGVIVLSSKSFGSLGTGVI